MKVREEVIVGASSLNKYFISDGGNVVLDFVDADGHLTGTATPTLDKRYFQGPGVDQLLAQERFANNVSQQVLWILPDHLGSTRELVDTLGKVVAHYQYDSFCVLLDGRENVTRYQFTGREHDGHTDLNYHRARWYDPLTGKWMSEDPIGLTAGDPNFTRYVGNGVLNATDLSGLVQIGIFFEGSGFLTGDAFDWSVVRNLWEEYDTTAQHRYDNSVSYDYQSTQNMAFYYNFVLDLSGGDIRFIVNIEHAKSAIKRMYNNYNDRKVTLTSCIEPFYVDIIGWSRGAIAAITFANDLKSESSIQVRFPGLIDPVTAGINPLVPYDTTPTNYSKALWAYATEYGPQPWFWYGQVLPPPGFVSQQGYAMIHEDIGWSSLVYSDMRSHAQSAGVQFS